MVVYVTPFSFLFKADVNIDKLRVKRAVVLEVAILNGIGGVK